MQPILEINGISKKFRISHNGAGYVNFRDAITSVFSRKKQTTEEFWALRDITFNVMPGDAVGILGKNGAGKSTLLKILSKITPPTEGKIISRGRIASLLEVGTGFHPELTGKENVFLNGSILGMTRKEIVSKFDEIIDFSGTEKFVDTPLKHYSSGMQLRLAFSVAAFLEPEILIIDEVLAVGDFEFQNKCIGKMEAVTKSGRTILFVSHNISAVSALCKTGLLLSAGKIAKQGAIGSVIHEYMMHAPDTISRHGVAISITYNHPEKIWVINSAAEVRVKWPQSRYPDHCYVDLAFYKLDGTKVFSLQSQKLMESHMFKSANEEAIFTITNPGFNEMELRVDVGLKSHPEGKYDILIENAATLLPSSKYHHPYKANDTIITPMATCRFA
ncbi:MAG TPA: ABC transporter ATP-binding protein [Bacteroidia bacterium]|nr:ABC transporter ATP-binding protein [Bacteroidia bacterium]